MYSRAVTINPRDAHARYNLALGAWEEGRLADATASMKEAAHAGHPLAREALPKIEKQRRLARDATPGPRQPEADNGIELFSLGQYEAALAVFQRDRRGPADARGWFLEGQCLRRLGRYEQAARVFQNARTADLVLASLWAAVSYKNSAQFRLAESLATEVLGKDPLLLDAHYILADIYRIQGDATKEDLAVRSLFMIDRIDH